MQRIAGQSYFWQEEILPGTTRIVDVPDVSAHKRSISDIGWQVSRDMARVYVTIHPDAYSTEAIWSEADSGSPINRTVTALKIENIGTEAIVAAVRVNFN